MTNFTGSKPTRSESQIAKNYLRRMKLAIRNRIVNAYIEFAELRQSAETHVHGRLDRKIGRFPEDERE